MISSHGVNTSGAGAVRMNHGHVNGAVSEIWWSYNGQSSCGPRLYAEFGSACGETHRERAGRLLAHGLMMGDVGVVTETAGVVSLAVCKYARYCRK